MERGSSKHGPALDNDLAREAESHTRGAPGGSRSNEWREPEPAGEDQPEPTTIPAGEHPSGAPPPLSGEELEARSSFGRWIPRSALPARRDELVRAADAVDAPAEVLMELQGLPADQTFDTVYEIWDALGYRNEPAYSTGEGEDTGPAENAGQGEPTS